MGWSGNGFFRTGPGEFTGARGTCRSGGSRRCARAVGAAVSWGGGEGGGDARNTGDEQAPPPPPTVWQVTGRLIRHPAALSEEERTALKDVLARCPELDTAAGHVRNFGEMLTGRRGSTLPSWINAVDAGQSPGLANFALHLLRDLDAVAAGLTLNWSSGGTEGAVNRIKKIKRQLCGRAGFELLCKMILLQRRSATASQMVRRNFLMPLVRCPARQRGARPRHGPRSAAALPT